jgi:hypothetical protein
MFDYCRLPRQAPTALLFFIGPLFLAVALMHSLGIAMLHGVEISMLILPNSLSDHHEAKANCCPVSKSIHSLSLSLSVTRGDSEGIAKWKWRRGRKARK